MTRSDEFEIGEALNQAVPAETENHTAAALTEDLALAQLKDPELSLEAIEQLSRDAAAIESRKVRFAVAAHRRTPRRIGLRIVRELYTFELMQFALSPAVAADLKRVADELLLSRLIPITLGERIAHARRSSTVWPERCCSTKKHECGSQLSKTHG